MRAASLAPRGGVVIVLALSVPAHADDGMRCGQWLVRAGMRPPEVAAKCGPPQYTATRQRCDARRCVQVDDWTYDRGPTELVRTAIFVDGVLASVEVGNHGTP